MKRLNVIEASEQLNMSVEMVRYYLRKGKLKGSRLGRDWFISQKKLDEFKIKLEVKNESQYVLQTKRYKG